MAPKYAPASIVIGALLRPGPLRTLRNVQCIEGDLVIEHTRCASFLGSFRNIVEIRGSLVIIGLPEAHALPAFDSLVRIKGDLQISRCSGLSTLTPFPHLTHIGGTFTLEECPQVAAMDDVFPALISLRGLALTLNPQIKSIPHAAFPRLERLASLTCSKCVSLTSIDAFTNVSRLKGSLELSDLANLNALQGLTDIERISGSLTISECHALQTLGWFESLRKVGGSLTVTNNERLTRLDLAGTIQTVGNEIVVQDNNALEETTLTLYEVSAGSHKLLPFIWESPIVPWSLFSKPPRGEWTLALAWPVLLIVAIVLLIPYSSYSATLAFVLVGLFFVGIIVHPAGATVFASGVLPPLVPRSYPVRWGKKENRAGLLLLVVEASQLAVFAFNPKFPWPFPTRTGSAVLLLKPTAIIDFESPSGAITSGMSILFVVLVGLRFLLVSPKYGSATATLVAPFLMPLTNAFTSVLVCTFKNGTATWDLVPSVTCYEGEHLFWSIVALMGLAFFVPTLLFAKTIWSLQSPALDLKFKPVFSLIQQLLAVALAATLAFFEDRRWVYVISHMVLLGVLTTLTAYMKPSSSHMWLNVLRVGLYGAAFVCSLGSAVVIAVDSDSDWTGSILVLIGMGVVALLCLGFYRWRISRVGDGSSASSGAGPFSSLSSTSSSSLRSLPPLFSSSHFTAHSGSSVSDILSGTVSGQEYSDDDSEATAIQESGLFATTPGSALTVSPRTLEAIIDYFGGGGNSSDSDENERTTTWNSNIRFEGMRDQDWEELGEVLDALTSVQGSITFEDCPMTELPSGVLAGLESIEGNLSFGACNNLTQFGACLPSLASLGGSLLLVQCTGVTSFSPEFLPLLDTVEKNVVVRSMEALETLEDGLDALVRIGGDLRMIQLDALDTSLGFSSLSHVDGQILLSQIPTESSLRGLDAVIEVGKGIEVSDLGVISLDILSLLPSCPSLLLDSCPSLTYVHGLSSLETVETSLEIRRCPRLQELGCARSLVSVDELVAVHSLRGVHVFDALEVVGHRIQIRGSRTLSKILFPSLVGVGDLNAHSDQVLGVAGDAGEESDAGDAGDAGDGVGQLKKKNEDEIGVEVALCDALTMFAAPRLEVVDGHLRFQHCRRVENLSGLANVEFVRGSVVVTHCMSMTWLGNLARLRLIGMDLMVKDCPKLDTLGDLDSLQCVYGRVEFRRLPLVSDLEGLSHLVHVGILQSLDFGDRTRWLPHGFTQRVVDRIVAVTTSVNPMPSIWRFSRLGLMTLVVLVVVGFLLVLAGSLEWVSRRFALVGCVCLVACGAFGTGVFRMWMRLTGALPSAPYIRPDPVLIRTSKVSRFVYLVVSVVEAIQLGSFALAPGTLGGYVVNGLLTGRVLGTESGTGPFIFCAVLGGFALVFLMEVVSIGSAQVLCPTEANASVTEDAARVQAHKREEYESDRASGSKMWGIYLLTLFWLPLMGATSTWMSCSLDEDSLGWVYDSNENTRVTCLTQGHIPAALAGVLMMPLLTLSRSVFLPFPLATLGGHLAVFRPKPVMAVVERMMVPAVVMVTSLILPYSRRVTQSVVALAGLVCMLVADVVLGSGCPLWLRVWRATCRVVSVVVACVALAVARGGEDGEGVLLVVGYCVCVPICVGLGGGVAQRYGLLTAYCGESERSERSKPSEARICEPARSGFGGSGEVQSSSSSLASSDSGGIGGIGRIGRSVEDWKMYVPPLGGENQRRWVPESEFDLEQSWDSDTETATGDRMGLGEWTTSSSHSSSSESSASEGGGEGSGKVGKVGKEVISDKKVRELMEGGSGGSADLVAILNDVLEDDGEHDDIHGVFRGDQEVTSDMTLEYARRHFKEMKVVVGDVVISTPLSATVLTAFSSLVVIHGNLTIRDCPTFRDLAGLSALRLVTGKVEIERCGVQSLDGLRYLERAHSIVVKACPALTQVTAPWALDHVALEIVFEECVLLENVSGVFASAPGDKKLVVLMYLKSLASLHTLVEGREGRRWKKSPVEKLHVMGAPNVTWAEAKAVSSHMYTTTDKGSGVAGPPGARFAMPLGVGGLGLMVIAVSACLLTMLANAEESSVVTLVVITVLAPMSLAALVVASGGMFGHYVDRRLRLRSREVFGGFPWWQTFVFLFDVMEILVPVVPLGRLLAPSQGLREYLEANGGNIFTWTFSLPMIFLAALSFLPISRAGINGFARVVLATGVGLAAACTSAADGRESLVVDTVCFEEIHIALIMLATGFVMPTLFAVALGDLYPVIVSPRMVLLSPLWFDLLRQACLVSAICARAMFGSTRPEIGSGIAVFCLSVYGVSCLVAGRPKVVVRGRDGVFGAMAWVVWGGKVVAVVCSCVVVWVWR